MKWNLHFINCMGFFNGAVSAPAVVQPSQVISIIFNRKEPEFESMEEAKSFLGNVMALWNVVVTSTSGEAPMAWPETVFQRSDSGLKEYIHAINSSTKQF